MARLVLARDFSRFLEDDEFLHRVEVFIGNNKFVCCGMLLAQQSSVLEQKIRDEQGILMFEEMLDIGSDNHKIDCIKFLYGSPITFNLENVETVLKFSSIYKVEDMFGKALNWVKQTISPRSLPLYYKVHKSIGPHHFTKFQIIIHEFIQKNVNQCGIELAELLTTSQTIDPGLFIDVLLCTPKNGNDLLMKWGITPENISLIFENADNLDFVKLFPNQTEFGSFVSLLTQYSASVDTMKAALSLQQNYFAQLTKCHDAGTSAHEDVEDNASETASVSSKSKAKGKKKRPKKESSADNQKQQGKEKKNQNEATPPNEDKLQLERKIFVGNIPDNVTVEEMEEVFSGFGPIAGIDLVPNRKCAFVQFRSVKTSRKVLKLAEEEAVFKVGDTSVYIKPFTVNSTSKDVQNTSNPEKKLFIGNIPENAKSEDIKKAFESFGPVVGIDLVRHKKCAFVEFENIKTVRKVLNMFANGHKYIVLNTQVYVKPFELVQNT